MEIEKDIPLISVIVPIYNSEKYLERCIDSICSQTYTNLEVILVNDGSTDSSLSICQKFASIDSRVLINDIPNGGVSNARNTGIKSANGTYIQFLDSDDYMLDNYIQVLYDLLIYNQADMVVCSIKVLDNNLTELDYWDAENHVLDFAKPDSDVVFNLFDRFLVFGPVNKLFKSAILKNEGILYDTAISYGEDMLLNLEYLQCINKIVFTNEVYWPYVQDNVNSLSNKRRDDKIDIVKLLHGSIENFLDKIKCKEKRFEKLLNQRMFDYCYNESFAIARDNTVSFFSKRSLLKKMFSDKSLIVTYPDIDRNKYASWVIMLMKYKLSSIFLLIIK